MTEPDTAINPRLSSIAGVFLILAITLGAIAWGIGIIGWAILTWQQVLS